MIKFINKSFFNLIIVISLVIIGLLSFSIFNGVYFLGDTVSYFEFSSVGGPLTTFIIHQSLWTPLFSLILNIYRYIPLNSIFIASLTTLTFFVVSYMTIFSIIKSLSIGWKKALLVSTLALSVGHLAILIQSYMSEPLMILLVLLSLFSFFKFWDTSQELWLMSWVLISALVPLARYLGAPIIIWLSALLFFKLVIGLKNKSKLKYSSWLLLMSLVFIWVPIGIYMFKTKVTAGSFMGVRDLRSSLDLSKMATKYIINLWNDLYLLIPITLLTGLTTKTKEIKKIFFYTLVFMGSASIYLMGLFYSETRFFVDPHLPSRYIAISYPFIIVGSFLFGIILNYFLAQRVKLFKKVLPYLNNLIYSFLLLFLIVSLYTNFQRLNLEAKDITSAVTGVYSTRDIKLVCRKDLNKNILIHDHSRNWILKSYFHFCDGNMNRLTLENDLVEKGSRLLSAYKINSLALEQIYYIDADGYDLYVYDVKQDSEIDVNQVFLNRNKFD